MLRSEEAPTVWLGDPLGKDLIDAVCLLGLPHFNAKLSSSARGKLACHSNVENVGEGRLIGKGKLQSLFRTWKGQLVSLETEVDRDLLSILEGLEKFGLAHNPNCGRRKKEGKRWVPRVNLGPCVIPNPILELGSLPSMGVGCGVTSSPNYCSVSLEFSPEVVLVPKTVFGDVWLDGSSLARPKGAGGPVLVPPCVKPVV